MAMIEHSIFSDIPTGKKNGRFHSAILTTYAVDLIHFDNHLVNLLHRKQISSINILADSQQLEKEMEYVNPRFMKNIGKDYCISGISSKGVFHPKINFFVGDDSILVVFGTGNLTVTGQGKNHEAFTGLMIDETDVTQRPLIEECWRFITRFAEQLSPFERRRVLNEVSDNCTYLDSKYDIVPHQLCNIKKGVKAALLYNDNTSSILKQISGIVPFEKVLNVTVVSPFFDEKGESLLTLAELCPNSKIDVLIDERCSLPPCKMPETKQICFYGFNDTTRGKQTLKIYTRQLHAKIYHFKTKSTEYCVIGSANATIAGLGTLEKRGRNEEFGIIYASQAIDFLRELGIKPKKKLNKKLHDMKRTSSKEEESTAHKCRVLSATYDSGRLSIICNQPIAHNLSIAIDYGDNITKKDINKIDNSTCYIETIIGKKLATCYIINAEGECLSNKVFINRLDQLEATNPSQASRSLNRFISQIEDEGYEGIEVAGMLSEIMWDLVNDESDEIKPIKVSSSVKGHQSQKTLPQIAYNAALDNNEVNSSRGIHVDRTSRLIECIEDSIRKKIHSIEDAITDEEESGNAETSNDRNIVEQKEVYVSKKTVKDYGDISNSVLLNYLDLIQARTEQIRKSGINVITKDDLNYFSLSIFTSAEICYLKRHLYHFDEIDNICRSSCQKILYDSLDGSMNTKGVEALERFSNFCVSYGKNTSFDDDFKKKAERAMKYSILFAALFYRNATVKEEHIKRRVLKAMQSLIGVFGLPSEDYLEEELTPLAERYDYAYHYRDIKKLIEIVKNNK